MSQLHTLIAVSLPVSPSFCSDTSHIQEGQGYAQKLHQALEAQIKLQDLSMDTTPSSIYTLR